MNDFAVYKYNNIFGKSLAKSDKHVEVIGKLDEVYLSKYNNTKLGRLVKSEGGLIKVYIKAYNMLLELKAMAEAASKFNNKELDDVLDMTKVENKRGFLRKKDSGAMYDCSVDYEVGRLGNDVERLVYENNFEMYESYCIALRDIEVVINCMEAHMNKAAELLSLQAETVDETVEVKEDTDMREVNTVKAVKTVADEIDELLSNSEAVVNKEDTDMRENEALVNKDDNSITEIVTEYETDNVNAVEVASISEDGTVEVLRPIIKKNEEACKVESLSVTPDTVKVKSEVVVTADDLRAELRQLQDLEEHEVSDAIAHKIISNKLDILITQEGGVYKAQALDKKAVSKLMRMFGCFKLENKAINRLSMEKKYFDMLAVNTTPTDGSKHRAKLLKYLETCKVDIDGWIIDHLGRRWLNPLTGALAEGVTAGDNYSKGGRWFTVLPNGEACSFPDYWVSIAWLALLYKNRLSWDGLVYWFTSGTTEVNHKDGNRLECALDNIELVHSWDNARHAAFMRMFAGCGFFNSKWIEYKMKDGRAGAGHWEMDFGVSAQLVGLEFNRCRTYNRAPKLNKEKAWDHWSLCGHHELNNVKNNIWQEAEEAYYKRRGITC